MTTPTTLYPAVTDYLVAACKASSALGTATPVPVIIHDGPETSDDTLAAPRHLWIGGLPSQHGDGQPRAAGTQDFSFSGDQATTRDEKYDIDCAADSWGGATNLKQYRDDCLAIVNAISLMLRGRPQAGGPGDFSLGGLVFWAAVTGPIQWFPRQTPDGAGMYCMFGIHYEGRTFS